jgi:hypothetical protein
MAEEHIGLTDPDAFELTTSGETVTTRHLFADGGDGKEKEATVLSEFAGASSDAPASSGIPSAVKQHGVQNEMAADKDETPMGGRVQPLKQNLEP